MFKTDNLQQVMSDMPHQDEKPEDPDPSTAAKASPLSASPPDAPVVTAAAAKPAELHKDAPLPRNRPFGWLKIFSREKEEEPADALREAIEEYIEEAAEQQDSDHIETHRDLVTKVLKTRDMTVEDVMIPRVDIIAVDIDIPFDDLKALLTEQQFSRLPVYRESLDDVLGTIHIKDILASLMAGKEFKIADHIRSVPLASPSMPLLDLLHIMRNDRKHMALVVDEFGGIDGLVTINDVIEALVGDIDDEFDDEEVPHITARPDGSHSADARMEIEEFEELYGEILTDEEREEIETLGGLVISLAERVPAHGEIFQHRSGMTMEVIEADSRRVKRLRLHNLPQRSDDGHSA